MIKAELSASLLQSSVSHDPSEIILICCSRSISDYYQCLKQSCCFIILSIKPLMHVSVYVSGQHTSTGHHKPESVCGCCGRWEPNGSETLAVHLHTGERPLHTCWEQRDHTWVSHTKTDEESLTHISQFIRTYFTTVWCLCAV